MRHDFHGLEAPMNSFHIKCLFYERYLSLRLRRFPSVCYVGNWTIVAMETITKGDLEKELKRANNCLIKVLTDAVTNTSYVATIRETASIMNSQWTSSKKSQAAVLQVYGGVAVSYMDKMQRIS